jgi:hypothetical protein
LQPIQPILTPELERHTASAGVARSKPYPVQTYRALVEHIARLAYLNRDHLLFFRGQARDYRSKEGGATFYPTIYRGESLSREEMDARFRSLDAASQKLSALFRQGKIDGHADITRKKLVQWSILQHYEVCPTPLIDFTQSVRVACSFAQMGDGRSGFVYVFGLPYLTNRISSNSEQDLVLVRLLSICPPSALRPYFQEGYLAGTADITTEYEDQSELDFNQRLIAQFEIPTLAGFWGRGLSRIGDSELFPSDDSIQKLCSSIEISITAGDEVAREALGSFMAEWTALEQLLVARAQTHEGRVFRLGQALGTLRRRGVFSSSILDEIESLRKLRNRVVHGPEYPLPTTLRQAVDRVRQVRTAVQNEPIA